jgi:hypothetical protein
MRAAGCDAGGSGGNPLTKYLLRHFNTARHTGH